jgi:hypothetical protein
MLAIAAVPATVSALALKREHVTRRGVSSTSPG